MIPIILAIQSQEEQAVALALWEEYKDIMYKIAFKYFKNREDAEDAVQDTFLRIIKHIDKFYGEKATNVKSLIFIYIKGTCINNYNKDRKNTNNTISLCNEDDEFIDVIDNNTLSPDIVLENKELSAVVGELISKLDDKYKDVLILKYYHGFKDTEIAEALDITLSNVGVRAHRAKALLAKEIEKSKKYKELMKGSV